MPAEVLYRCPAFGAPLEAVSEAVEPRGGSRPTPRARRIWPLGWHSDGFAWGYGGSGPAELAAALLLDVLGDAERARRLYQAFKWQKLAGLDQYRPFQMSGAEVRAWVASHRENDQ